MQKMRKFTKENRRGAFSPETATAVGKSGELDRATIVTTIRRMGFIAVKCHQVIMSRLLEQGEQQLAERFNDVFKPLADMLLHFELDSNFEQENEEGGANGV